MISGRVAVSLEAAAHVEVRVLALEAVDEMGISGGDRGYVCGRHYRRRVCRRNQRARHLRIICCES